MVSDPILAIQIDSCHIQFVHQQYKFAWFLNNTSHDFFTFLYAQIYEMQYRK